MLRQTPSALAALFPASSPSDSDLAAATALAGAFSEPPSESAPDGRPARASDRDLSLDHLFREIAEGTDTAVTLDSFYGSSAGGAAAPEGGLPTLSDEEANADLQRFTKWLEGLKKK